MPAKIFIGIYNLLRMIDVKQKTLWYGISVIEMKSQHFTINIFGRKLFRTSNAHQMDLTIFCNCSV